MSSSRSRGGERAVSAVRGGSAARGGMVRPRGRRSPGGRAPRTSCSATRARARAGGAAAAGGRREADVVVVGGGLGGLCAGALLAHYGKEVTVLEAHDVAGGAAHAWKRGGYTFESGPSLYSGMAVAPGETSTNPFTHVLQALGEAQAVDYRKYDNWMCHLPGMGSVLTKVGAEQFREVLLEHEGPAAVREWVELGEMMRPLAQAATAISPASVRSDIGAVVTLGRLLPKLLSVPLSASKSLMQPFSDVIKGEVENAFIRNWLDMLCFLLSGAPASGTAAAEIGFMFDDWFRPNAALEYPVGGSGALVEALVRGLEKFGGRLELNSPVSEVLLDDTGAASGVRLEDGSEVRAREAVISNATVWDTRRLLPAGAAGDTFEEAFQETEECDSFMHLHLGIDAAGLPADLDMHHIVVNSWDAGVDSPQNMVLVSIPSIIDPSMAPEGKHVVHAYTPGTEPYSIWEGLDPKGPEYKALKEERAEVLWRAVEKAIPDVRQRCEITMIGTPLTHQRFLRRHRGAYGGRGWVAEGKTGSGLPSVTTPIERLICVGDSCFPGPGVPAVAAAGTIAAHSLVKTSQQMEMLSRIGL